MKKVYEVDLYKDASKEWCWRVEADNGNVIGASSEGYKNKGDMVKNIKSLNESFTQFFKEDEEE